MNDELVAYQKFLKKKKTNIPFWKKKVLTVEEAAAYTGIGRTKIRQIIMQDNCPFTIFNGAQVYIIKDKFIEYLDNQFRI